LLILVVYLDLIFLKKFENDPIDFFRGLGEDGS